MQVRGSTKVEKLIGHLLQDLEDEGAIGEEGIGVNHCHFYVQIVNIFCLSTLHFYTLWEIPDLVPGPLPQKSDALPMSYRYHISSKELLRLLENLSVFSYCGIWQRDGQGGHHS